MGEVWTWGSNEYGQLGRDRRLYTPQQIDALQIFTIVQVTCGSHFTCALTGKIKNLKQKYFNLQLIHF
jgi:alpha-tubulin suppressor-like RCC1 family protein